MTDSKPTEAQIAAAKAAYWHEVHNGGGYSDKCYEAAIAAVISDEPSVELLFRSYLGLCVLRAMMRKAKLDAGLKVTEELLQDISSAHPEFAPRSALRSTTV